MTDTNFRITVTADEDDIRTLTLSEFVADNEGAPGVCERVAKLNPGEEIVCGNIRVRRFAVKAGARYARVRVPISFDKAKFATLTIDRKRMTMSIRPAHKRMVVTVELGSWAQKMLEKEAVLAANAKLARKRKSR